MKIVSESKHLPGNRPSADHRDHCWQWLPSVVPAAPQVWLLVAGQMLAVHIWTEWTLASHPCNEWTVAAIYVWTIIIIGQRNKGALFVNDDFTLFSQLLTTLFNKFHDSLKSKY